MTVGTRRCGPQPPCEAGGHIKMPTVMFGPHFSVTVLSIVEIFCRISLRMLPFTTGLAFQPAFQVGNANAEAARVSGLPAILALCSPHHEYIVVDTPLFRESMLARKRREYRDYLPQFYDISPAERTEDEQNALRQVQSSRSPHPRRGV